MMMPLICSCINEKTTLSHIPVGYPPPGMKKSHVMMLVILCSHCVHAVFTLCSRGEGERATTLSSQTTGHRAGSVHLVEKLCTFSLLDIQKHSWRACGHEGPRGIGSGCEAHSARTQHNTTCIKQGYKTSAKPNSPWSPSQEGARGQGSSACRGTPSRGEARTLHHQPVPALTLTMPCLSCSRPTFTRP